ncbi:MAG: acyltransferase [Alphaproteobacteria bacterium]|nr:acyltransferase [Alphaproteobacteria bacterium]
MTTAREYIPTFTSLRGIAALLIVVEHFSVFFSIIDQLGIPWKNQLWVDFFFILSGFVITLSYAHLFDNDYKFKDYRTFMRRRIVRLYPAHIVTLMAMMLVEIYRVYIYTEMNTDIIAPPFTWDSSDPRSIPTLITNVFLVQSWWLHKNISWNQPSWSISCEFFVALVFPLLLSWFYRTKAFLLPLLLCFLGYYLVIWFDDPNNYINVTLLHCVLGSSCGVLLCKKYLRDKEQSKILADSTLLSIVFLLCFFYLEIFYSDWMSIPLFCLLIYGAAHNRGYFFKILMNPILQFLGKISYSLYLTHFVVLNWLNMLMLYHFHKYTTDFPPLENGLLCLAYLAVTLVLSTICYHLFERIVPRFFSGPSESGKPFVRQFESSDAELIERFSRRLQEMPHTR